MTTEIALATVSGKAYYKLVRELKKRSLSFLSLKPGDPVPLDVKVVITTEKERQKIAHSNILTFEEETDPAAVVDEALRLAQGKQEYDEVVIGVDPGRTFGVAIVGDGRVLETTNCQSQEETVDAILKALNTPAKAHRVKVGNGAPAHTKELLHSIDKAISKEAIVEVVHEAGTSRFTRGSRRKELRDVTSAARIARRRGQAFPRRKGNETRHRRK